MVNGEFELIYSFLIRHLYLFHRNGLNEPQLSFSTISAVFESIEVPLHELLIFIKKCCNTGANSTQKEKHNNIPNKRSWLFIFSTSVFA